MISCRSTIADKRQREIAGNMKLVYFLSHKFQKRYQFNRIGIDDIVGEATLGLIKAVDRYDPEKNDNRGAFYAMVIWRYLQDAARSPRWRYPDSQGMTRLVGYPGEEIVDLVDLVEAVEFAIDDPARREVFLTIKRDGFTYKEAARKLGVKYPTVRFWMWETTKIVKKKIRELYAEDTRLGTNYTSQATN